MTPNPNEPQPVKFPEVNFTYTSPKGMEETCGSLPCHIVRGDNTKPAMAISCWKFPTRDQRLKFLKDGLMWLTVIGSGHPPVALGVSSPFVEGQEEVPKEKQARLVLLEFPRNGSFWNRRRWQKYAKACIKDSVFRGESPAWPNVTPFSNSWGVFAEATVVYEDLGVTEEMKAGIDAAEKEGRQVERRRILPAL